MENIVVVTGGGTGIGSALAKLLSSKHELKVLIIGRTIETLKQTAEYNKNIDYIQSDISTDEGIGAVIQYIIDKQYRVKYLVNNAVVQNLSKLEDVTSDLFFSSMNTNVKAPLMLVSEMLKANLFWDKARVLMIDSSSRYNIQNAMGLYAISKAALFTMCKVMQKELKNKLLVNSLYPGTVNKTCTSEGMGESNILDIIELRARMKEFLKNNKNIRILSPEDAAEFIMWILYETSDDVFVNAEKAIKKNVEVLNAEQWDIRDSECYIGCDLTAGSKLRMLSGFLGE